jgi:hypothetical protein
MKMIRRRAVRKPSGGIGAVSPGANWLLHDSDSVVIENHWQGGDPAPLGIELTG